MNIREMLDNIQGAVENLDIDEALDLRDSEEFDSEWVRVYHLVEERKTAESEECRGIREKAYISALEFGEYEDIAACVSDDFGLIFDAESVGFCDPWLDKLIDCYRRSVFPCGKL